MKEITVSVNPTYYCNLRCEFCYLSKEQLSSKRSLDPDRFMEMMSELSERYSISHVDLYGGEVAMMPVDDLESICSTIMMFNNGATSINTNLTLDSWVYENEWFDLSVSYDFEGRQDHENVWRRMVSLDRPFSVISVGTKTLFKKTPKDLVAKLKTLKNLTSYEIKPYSVSQFNGAGPSQRDYEDFVLEVCREARIQGLNFINEVEIQKALNGNRIAYSEDHIYITPNGKFAVLDFVNEMEHFVELDSLAQYDAWVSEEFKTINDSEKCKGCRFLGGCLSEHLIPNLKDGDDCNGFPGLLEAYSNERTRLENNHPRREDQRRR